MICFGNVPLGSVLPVFFSTYGKTNGESITLTGLAVTDVEIYKGTSITQRASDAGYALIDTDGIDVDGVTGIHAFSIDTGDNTDAGFYAAGSFYNVVVSAVTIDSQTVNFIAATFRIVAAEGVAGVPDANMTHVADTAQTAGDLKASLDTIDDFIDTEVAAIKAKTDNLPASPAAVGSAMTLAADSVSAAALAADAGTEIAAAVFARAFSAAYGSYTFDELVKMMAAVLLGKVSGMDTNSPAFRNLADSADVLTATTSSGNRTAVTRTP